MLQRGVGRGTGYVGLFSIVLMIGGALVFVFSLNALLSKPRLVITEEGVAEKRGLLRWKMSWSEIESASVEDIGDVFPNSNNPRWWLCFYPRGVDATRVSARRDATIKRFHSSEFKQFDEIVKLVTERVAFSDFRPRMLSEHELVAIIDRILDANQPLVSQKGESPKEIRVARALLYEKIVQLVMSELRGSADPAKVKQLIRAKMGENESNG